MEIKCPACGKNSPLGRVLCMHCGERVHATDAKGKKAKKGPGIITRFVKNVVGLIKAIITLGLLAAITLTLLPKKSEAEVGGKKELTSYEEKIMKFDATNRSGVKHTETFTEAEINAFLAEVTNRENRADKPVYMLDFDSIAMDLGDGEAELITTLAKGPIKISLAIDLIADEEGNGFVVNDVTIGRLPAGPAKDIVAAKVVDILAGLEVEAKTIQRASVLKAAGAELFVRTQ